MALLDELRDVVPHIPPSHIPTIGEALGIIGALVAHCEHGTKLFEAAEQGTDEVNRLFAEEYVPQASPAPVEQTPVAPPDSPAPAETPAPVSDAGSLEAENAQLKAQIAALQGEQQRTQATVEPLDPTPPPAPSAPAA